MTSRARVEASAAPADDKPQTIEMKPKSRRLTPFDSALLKDVQVSLEAKLGHADLSVSELLALRAGSVVVLDLQMNEPIELRLNGSLVARGEIVAVDDHFAVRIVEIAELS